MDNTMADGGKARPKERQKNYELQEEYVNTMRWHAGWDSSGGSSHGDDAADRSVAIGMVRRWGSRAKRRRGAGGRSGGATEGSGGGAAGGGEWR